jgi:hypothetical protein
MPTVKQMRRWFRMAWQLLGILIEQEGINTKSTYWPPQSWFWRHTTAALFWWVTLWEGIWFTSGRYMTQQLIKGPMITNYHICLSLCLPLIILGTAWYGTTWYLYPSSSRDDDDDNDNFDWSFVRMMFPTNLTWSGKSWIRPSAVRISSPRQSAVLSVFSALFYLFQRIYLVCSWNDNGCF